MSDKQVEKVLSLQVSVQIIKHISSGLYRSPASALKELLSNSYDAEAKNVRVEFHFLYDDELKPSLQRISVKDDGNGMDLQNLIYAFTHIGGSTKELEEKKKTEVLHRDVIGRLGIGMLSVASACRSFTVKTKKKGEDKEFRAEISLGFFDSIRELKETMDKFSIGNVRISSSPTQNKESYTEVEISDFKPPFLDNILDHISDSYFYYKDAKRDVSNDMNAYFINFIEKMGEELKLGKLPVFDQVIAQLGLMAPVEYLPDGPVRPIITDKNGQMREVPGANDNTLRSIKDKLKEAEFNVYCKIIKEKAGEVLRENEFKLFKPIRYPLDSDLKKFTFEILEPYVETFTNAPGFELTNEAGEKVRAMIRGYAYHQYARILPHEFRGILYRVFNVAIGDYFRDELRLYSEDPVILHQLEIEVYLDEGFESIVNLDRESLYEGSRTYLYLKHYLDNLFKGRTPVKPALTMPSSEKVFESSDVTVAEGIAEEQKKARLTPEDDKFYDKLASSLTEREGLIDKIKGKRAKERTAEIEKMNPRKMIASKIRLKYKTNIIEIEHSADESQFGAKVAEEGSLKVTVPRVKGSRSKVWDAVFATAAIWGPEDDKQRKELIKILYEIYKMAEKK